MKRVRRAILLITVLSACTLGAAGVKAYASPGCPPVFAGDWNGTGFPSTSSPVNLSGVIDISNGHQTGTLSVDGNDPGVWDGDLVCDHVTGTDTDPRLGSIDFAATLSDDGRTMSGTFHSQFGDGTFVLDISANAQSVSLGDSTIVEGGGGSGGAALARAATASTAVKIPKSAQRVVTIPVTLTNPANSKLTVHYSFVDGTATRGTDYIDTGVTHSLTFARGQYEKTVTVSTITNSIAQDDREFVMQIDDIAGIGFHTFKPFASITIKDDDRVG